MQINKPLRKPFRINWKLSQIRAHKLKPARIDKTETIGAKLPFSAAQALTVAIVIVLMERKFKITLLLLQFTHRDRLCCISRSPAEQARKSWQHIHHPPHIVAEAFCIGRFISA